MHRSTRTHHTALGAPAGRASSRTSSSVATPARQGVDFRSPARRPQPQRPWPPTRAACRLLVADKLCTPLAVCLCLCAGVPPDARHSRLQRRWPAAREQPPSAQVHCRVTARPALSPRRGPAPSRLPEEVWPSDAWGGQTTVVAERCFVMGQMGWAGLGLDRSLIPVRLQ